jgi:hypothetical protein
LVFSQVKRGNESIHPCSNRSILRCREVRGLRWCVLLGSGSREEEGAAFLGLVWLVLVLQFLFEICSIFPSHILQRSWIKMLYLRTTIVTVSIQAESFNALGSNLEFGS